MKTNFIRALAVILCLAVPVSPVAAQVAPSAAGALTAPGARLAAPQLAQFRQAVDALVSVHFPGDFSAVSALQNFAFSQHQGERLAMPMAEQAATQLVVEAVSAGPEQAQAALSSVDLPEETRVKLVEAARRLEAQSKVDPAVARALAVMRRQALPAFRIELPSRRTETRIAAFLKKMWASRAAQSEYENEGGLVAVGAELGGGPAKSTRDFLPPRRGPESSRGLLENDRPADTYYDQDITPSSKKIAKLLLAAEKDPAAGRTAAMEILKDQNERRVEVRISALRLIAPMPSKELLPFVLDLVENDFSWYIRRESARIVGARVADLGELKGRAEIAMRALYKSQLAPLRLMAKDVLGKMGIDPGQEPFVEEPHAGKIVPAPYHFHYGQESPQRPKKSSAFFIAISIVAMFFIGPFLFGTPRAPAPVVPQNQIVSMEKASQPQLTLPAGAAITPALKTAAEQAKGQVKPTLQSDQESLQQIAENTKKTAEAQARTARAMEEMSVPKGGGGIGSMVINALIFIGIMMGVTWLFRKMGKGGPGGGIGGGMGGLPGLNGGSKAMAERPTEQFSDVAGIDDAMVAVQQLADFLRNPEKYKRMGAQIPKGILLEGPPGTGKTLLAKALAGSTNAAFFPMSGSNFIELFVGVGASRVRDLFAKARSQSPAIIFIDEIDAVGKARGGAGPMSGSSSEQDQTINAILAEMDGFDGSSGVIVIAATNRADVLDEALTRPGRFDRKIYVGPPDVLGREAILQIHAASRRLAPEVDLRFIAQRTAGLAGASLKGMVNGAALLAVEKRLDAVGPEHFNEAVDNMTIGQQRNTFIPRELKKRVAEHETGHVVAMRFTKTGTIPNKVTIIPTGSGALGWAEPGGQEDKLLSTQPELEDQLVGYAGGMVAEEDVYGNISTGPGSDLAQATRIARGMVEKLGMSEEIGPIVISDPQTFGGRAHSEWLARRIDREIIRIITKAKAQAKEILTAHKAARDAIVSALMEKETLVREEIEEIIKRAEAPVAPPQG